MYGLAETSQMVAYGFTNATGSVTAFASNGAGTAHTLNAGGSFGVGFATAPFDVQLIAVSIRNITTSGPNRGLIDIAIGPSLAEIIVSGILFDFNRVSEHSYFHVFPVFIPAGAQIGYRQRSTLGNAAMNISIMLINMTTEDDEYLNRVESLGVDTNIGVGTPGPLDSGGTVIDAFTNSWCPWYELTPSTTYPCYAAKLIWGNMMNTAYSGAIMWQMQVGIGAIGEEQIAYDRIAFAGDGASDTMYPTEIDIPFVAPAGSRICVRANCSSGDITDRQFQVAMYLFSKR